MTFRFPSKALFLLTAALPLLGQGHDTYDGHDCVANQVILRLNSATTAVLQQLKLLGNADTLRALDSPLGIFLLHSPSGTVSALLAILKAHPAVTYVEPNYFVKTVTTPNDPNFSLQWSFLNTATPGADISATLAWDISTGSTANVVGVVDTGIDYTHPDLAANVWAAPASFTVNLSWGSLTCPAGSHGYNAITHSCDPRDDNQHGTHVSGTIGAIGNNSIGVAGVNWSTRIMALKFLDNTGSGSTSDAIDAIEFAIQAKSTFGANANVRVLSNSWGGSGFSQSLLDEINKANTNEMLFVVAAGNSSQNTDTIPSYPAAFNAPNLISVAATTNTDALASFSNFGPKTITMGAPGLNILSTLPNNAYGYLSGTSMATPHVSGAAMLLLSKCTLNTAALKTSLASNVDPIPSLAGITVTGGRLNVNKALRSCTGIVSQPAGSASFIKTDAGTEGNWKSAYGADGVNIIGDTTTYPSYVTVTPAQNISYTWAASTTDIRALQKFSSSTDRIAAAWYNPSSFSMDVKFSDQNTHQLALYLLDWDSQGRAERVDIVDGGTNAVIDTRSVSSFVGGQYLVWNLGGHVIVRVTNTNSNSPNAVVSGLLFGGGSTTQTANTAAFVKTDTTTSGTWKGVYGGDGANIIGDTANYPAYATVTPGGNLFYTWAASSTDPRALQKISSATDRIAACWYNSSTFSVDVRFNDQNTHQLALYLLDWDSQGRSERVDIVDGTTSAVLDTRSVSAFTAGQYLVWTLGGHVIVRVTNTNSSPNAPVSALLFGTGTVTSPATNAAAFVKTDTATSGSWKGIYGADGENVLGDTASYPAYATVTPSGFLSYTWAASTTDTRGLQKVASPTDRVAACWYNNITFAIDVQLTDANAHQVALYLVDWDNYNGRTERFDVLDGTTNALLDTRSVSSFVGGQYLVWNLTGHVIIRVTNTNPNANAVVSGIFFR